MFVCVCHAITEEQVERLLKQKVPPQDIPQILGIGSSCGVCLTEGVSKLVQKLHRSNKGPSGQTSKS